MKNLSSIPKIMLVALSMTLFNCDDKEDPQVYQQLDVATPQEFADIRQDALDSRTEKFQIETGNGFVVLTSQNGVEMSINSDCLTLNGNAVTGTVDIDYIELFDKADMLITNKPTMGIKPNGDHAVLISGGEFMIEATQNGEKLDTGCAINMRIPMNLTDSLDDDCDGDCDMTLWKGEIDENGDLAWEEDREGDGKDVNAEQGVYYTSFGEFGWTNVDRFYNDPRDKTTILVDVPEGYDNTNSAVYLSYDGEAPALAQLDTYDADAALFSEHYGQVPVGLECHVIFATEEDGNWRYAIKGITIIADETISITTGETTVGTEAELVQAINDLP